MLLRKKVFLLSVCTIACLTVLGCDRKEVANNDDLKKAFTKKEWSINDVPPEQRARVEAMMKAQQNSQSPPRAAASSGGTPGH